MIQSQANLVNTAADLIRSVDQEQINKSGCRQHTSPSAVSDKTHPSVRSKPAPVGGALLSVPFWTQTSCKRVQSIPSVIMGCRRDGRQQTFISVMSLTLMVNRWDVKPADTAGTGRQPFYVF